MRPVPSAEVLARFDGAQLVQVTLDPFQVRLAFDNEMSICAEHLIEHIEPNGMAYRLPADVTGWPPITVHRLLLQRVSAVEREEWYFGLRFADGSTLRVHSVPGTGESGNIWLNRSDMVLF